MNRNSKSLACSSCGTPTAVDVEASSVRCGRCVQAQGLRIIREQEERLSKLDPGEAKKLRKECGLTQAELSFIIKVPLGSIRSFEQGKDLCTEEHYQWLQDNGGAQ